MNLVLKLSPNKNYLTEELVGILSTEFKLFISNWKRFDPYFSPLKTKKGLNFYFPSAKTWKYESKSQSKGHEVHWGTVRYLMNCIQVVYFKLKEIWLLFSNAKAKNRARFLLPFRQIFEWKHEISVQIWPWTTCIQFKRYLSVTHWIFFGGGGEISSRPKEVIHIHMLYTCITSLSRPNSDFKKIEVLSIF